MLKESSPSSIWFVEQSSQDPDNRSLLSSYPISSLYKGEVLINGHLKKYWNTCWTKVVSVNEIIIGLIILILGIILVFFQLSLSYTGHGIWTGCLALLSGLLAFFTIIYRRHRFFLFVATIHILTGLASTILIFISVFAIALQISNTKNSNINDMKLNYGLHITLIILGLYEKLLCYTFLIMIIRHTHKMV